MTIKYTDYIKKDGKLVELEPKIIEQSNCIAGELTYASGVTSYSNSSRVIKNKIGLFCILNAAVSAIIQNGKFFTLFTVPDGFRPQSGYFLSCAITDGGSTYQGGECTIDRDGVVQIKTGSRLNGLCNIIVRGSYCIEI